MKGSESKTVPGLEKKSADNSGRTSLWEIRPEQAWKRKAYTYKTSVLAGAVTVDVAESRPGGGKFPELEEDAEESERVARKEADINLYMNAEWGVYRILY